MDCSSECSDSENKFDICGNIDSKIHELGNGSGSGFEMHIDYTQANQDSNSPTFIPESMNKTDENKRCSYNECKFDIYGHVESKVHEIENEDKNKIQTETSDISFAYTKKEKYNLKIKDFIDGKIQNENDNDEFSIPSFTPEDIKDLCSLRSPSPSRKTLSVDMTYFERKVKSSSPVSFNDKYFFERIKECIRTSTFMSEKEPGMKSLEGEVNLGQKKLDSDYKNFKEYSEPYQKYICEINNREEKSKVNDSLVVNLISDKQNEDLLERRVYKINEIGEKDCNLSNNDKNFDRKSKYGLTNTSFVSLEPENKQDRHSEKSLITKHDKTPNTNVEHTNPPNRHGDKNVYRSSESSSRRSRRSPRRSPKRISMSPSTKTHRQLNRYFPSRYDDKTKYTRRRGFEKGRKCRHSPDKFKYTRSRCLEKDREGKCSLNRTDDKSLMNIKSKGLDRENRPYFQKYDDKIIKNLEGNRENRILHDKDDENLMNVKNKSLEIDEESRHSNDKSDNNFMNLKNKDPERDNETDLTMNLKNKEQESNCESNHDDNKVNYKSKSLEMDGESKHSLDNYDDKSINFISKRPDRDNRHGDRYYYRRKMRRSRKSSSRSLSSGKCHKRGRKKIRSSSSSSYSSSTSSSSESKNSRKHRRSRRRRRSISRSPSSPLERSGVWLKTIGLTHNEVNSSHASTFHSDVNPTIDEHLETPEVEQLKELQCQRYKFIDEERNLRRELKFLSDQSKQLIKANFAADNPILVDNNKYQNELENKVKVINETVNMLSRRIFTINYLTSKMRIPEAKSNVGFTNSGIPTLLYDCEQPIFEPIDESAIITTVQEPVPMYTNLQHGPPLPLPIDVDQPHPAPVYIMEHNQPGTTNPQGLPLQPAMLKPMYRISECSPLQSVPPIDLEQSPLGLLHVRSHQPQITNQDPLNPVDRIYKHDSLLPVPIDVGQCHLDSIHIVDKPHQPEITNLKKIPSQPASLNPMVRISQHSPHIPLLIGIDKHDFNSVHIIGRSLQPGMTNTQNLLPHSVPSTPHQSDLKLLSQIDFNKPLLKPENSNDCKRKSKENLLDEMFVNWSKHLTKRKKPDETTKDVINLSDESRDGTSHQSAERPIVRGSNQVTKTGCSVSSLLHPAPGVMSATQKRSLMEKRNTYNHKMKVLQRELEFLADQRKLLTNENFPLSDPILKSNAEKQMEIRGNLETIKIVFNNLTTIIEEDDVLSKVDFGNRAKGTSTLKKIDIEDKLKTMKTTLDTISGTVEDIYEVDSPIASSSTRLLMAKKENFTEVPKIESKKRSEKKGTSGIVWSDEEIWGPGNSNSYATWPEEHTSKSNDKQSHNFDEPVKNEGNQHKNLLQEDSSKVKTSKVETNLNYTKFNQKPEPDEQITNKPKFNYVHYDPEMHWCRVCNVFPTTAKEYLNHLHSAEHKEFILEKKLIDLPWHENQNSSEEVGYVPGAPIKRVPIKGLQFFISATAWYCKICSTWIGDLHCASIHLKSTLHSEKYASFIQENPEWEVEWLIERTRAYEYSTQNKYQLNDNELDASAENHLIGKLMPDPIKQDKKPSESKETLKYSKHGEVSSLLKESIDKSSNNLPLVEKVQNNKDSNQNHFINKVPEKILVTEEFSHSSSESDDEMTMKIMAALKEIKDIKLKMLSNESCKPSSPSSEKLISVLKEIRESSSKKMLKAKKSSEPSSDNDELRSKQFISDKKNIVGKTSKKSQEMKTRKSFDESSPSDVDMGKSIGLTMRRKQLSSLPSTMNEDKSFNKSTSAQAKNFPDEEQKPFDKTVINPEQIENDSKNQREDGSFKEIEMYTTYDVQKRIENLTTKIEKGLEQNKLYKEHQDNFQGNKICSEQKKYVKEERDKPSFKNKVDTELRNRYTRDSSRRYSKNERRPSDNISSSSNKYGIRNQHSRAQKYSDRSNSSCRRRYEYHGRSPIHTRRSNLPNTERRKSLHSRTISEKKKISLSSDEIKLKFERSSGSTIANSKNLEMKVEKIDQNLLSMDDQPVAENLMPKTDQHDDKNLMSIEEKETNFDKPVLESTIKKNTIEMAATDKPVLESTIKKNTIEMSATDQSLTIQPTPPVFPTTGPIKFTFKNKREFCKPKIGLTQSVSDTKNEKETLKPNESTDHDVKPKIESIIPQSVSHFYSDFQIPGNTTL